MFNIFFVKHDLHFLAKGNIFYATIKNMESYKKLHKKYYIDEDVILVHKPIGISSFGLISKMRKILNTRKIGHAGTLDPLASGLMILGINKGTKKMKNYLGLDKVYIADIIIGKSTTTGDAEGDIIETKNFFKNDFKQEELNTTLQSFSGESYYPAPLYSAVKVLGKPLYKYAREEKKPPYIPEKKMLLKSIEIFDYYQSNHNAVITIRVCVGSGTYIRTLAEEFGNKIGYPASIKKLYRTSIDKYYDKDAFYIPEKKSQKKYDILKMYSLIKNLFRKNKK